MKVDRRKLFINIVMREVRMIFLLCSLVGEVALVSGADLVIRIPGDLSQQDGYYRLDYR